MHFFASSTRFLEINIIGPDFDIKSIAQAAEEYPIILLHMLNSSIITFTLILIFPVPSKVKN